MKAFEKDVLTLIRCAFSGGKPIISGGISVRGILNFCIAHHILGLIYGALEKVDYIAEDEEFAEIKKKYDMLAYVNLRQTLDLQRIGEIFNKNGIDYMPLKGAVLKTIYPSPTMRIMGDIDILIRESERDKVIALMQENGYNFVKESDHELVFGYTPACIELHKRLIPSYNLDYNRYYEDSWRFAKKSCGNEYAMTDEDFFVYIFTHFAKHYRDKGAGVKYIVDFYVFLKEKPNLNMAYIEEQLKELKLFEFYQNILELIDVWFKGKDDTKKSDFLTDKIFEASVYGKNDNYELSSLIKISKKYKRYRLVALMRLIFPSLRDMKNIFPVLNKCILLLPIMYIVRIISKIVQPKKVAQAINKMNGVAKSAEEVERYKSELNYVGLDYNFYDENDK